jgi:molybdate transport system substrate-binding protein
MLRTFAVAGVLALLAACSVTPTASSTPTTELVVFAAASLSDTYSLLGRTFEAAHSGVKVRFSFDGSSILEEQLAQGAPADVLATADRPTMDKAVAASLVPKPVLFATNTLTLIVPKGNPAGVTGLDASLHGKKLVVCADGVPCGSATAKLAALLGVTLEPVSEETKVTDVRAKVETGQADAGVVYVTDAKVAASTVDTIPIKEADRVRNDYLLGAVAGSRHSDLADAFVSWVTGPEGRTALSAAGFVTP